MSNGYHMVYTIVYTIVTNQTTGSILSWDNYST